MNNKPETKPEPETAMPEHLTENTIETVDKGEVNLVANGGSNHVHTVDVVSTAETNNSVNTVQYSTSTVKEETIVTNGATVKIHTSEVVVELNTEKSNEEINSIEESNKDLAVTDVSNDKVALIPNDESDVDEDFDAIEQIVQATFQDANSIARHHKEMEEINKS